MYVHTYINMCRSFVIRKILRIDNATSTINCIHTSTKLMMLNCVFVFIIIIILSYYKLFHNIRIFNQQERESSVAVEYFILSQFTKIEIF